MRVDVIPINELSEGMKQDWLKMQASNPSLMSPFFHPELFVSVGKYCPNVYVALLYKENVLMGFLPFLKDQKLLAAQRIPFCNFEAIISYPNQYWDMNIILKKMRLNSWNFDAIVDFENIKSKRGDFQIRNSFRIDLTCGLKEYWDFIQTKQVQFKTLTAKRRVLETMVGPLRFVANCNDIKAFHQHLQWKVARHNRDLEWERLATGILEYIYYLKDPLFQGIMPVLYAGDELVAVDFALRYQGRLGGVIRAFNPNFEKYSVGILLLHELIKECKALEYSIMDLGPGVYRYKQEYSNSSLPTIKGSFKVDSFKEKLKSMGWLTQGLLPMLGLREKSQLNGSISL